MYPDQPSGPGSGPGPVPGFGSDVGNGTDPGAGPDSSRGRLVAIFGGLAVLGLLIGVGVAQLAGSGSGDGAALNGATPTSPTDSASEQAEDESTATPSATATDTDTGTPNYSPIPENVSSEPGLDFGFLTRVVRNDGTVILRFDRASFYTGDEAKRRNKGKAPENDYLIENTNPAQRSFELDPKASIIAENRLRNEAGQFGRQKLTLDEFIKNSGRELTGSTTDLPVWLRHTDGLTGPVTALAEQFLP